MFHRYRFRKRIFAIFQLHTLDRRAPQLAQYSFHIIRQIDKHPYNGSDLGWALLSGGRVGKYVAQYCADMTMNSQNDLNDIQVRQELARYRALLEKKDGVTSGISYKFSGMLSVKKHI